MLTSPSLSWHGQTHARGTTSLNGRTSSMPSWRKLRRRRRREQHLEICTSEPSTPASALYDVAEHPLTRPSLPQQARRRRTGHDPQRDNTSPSLSYSGIEGQTTSRKFCCLWPLKQRRTQTDLRTERNSCKSRMQRPMQGSPRIKLLLCGQKGRSRRFWRTLRR